MPRAAGYNAGTETVLSLPLLALLIRWSQVRIPHGLPRFMKTPTFGLAFLFCAAHLITSTGRTERSRLI